MSPLTNDFLYSLANALKSRAMEGEEAEVEAEVVTNAVNLGISLVHALILLLLVEMVEGTVHLIIVAGIV